MTHREFESGVVFSAFTHGSCDKDEQTQVANQTLLKQNVNEFFMKEVHALSAWRGKDRVNMGCENFKF